MQRGKKKKYMGIREIADIAGVSIATVSRVLNMPEVTSARTREKVMDVIKKYDYVPNQAAKDLFAGVSNSIAIFIYDMSNPLYISIIQHLNRIAFENNYMLIICDAENSYERETKYYNYCKSIRTLGIVYTAGSTRDDIVLGNNKNTTTSIPIVLFDRSGFQDGDYYMVRSDHRKGMSLLVDYLYKLNHRKIGYITGNLSVLSACERYESFVSSMKGHELEIPPHYIKEGGFFVENGMEAFDYFYSMPDAPTAVIAANDLCARGFIMRANALGVKIPEEFSVCGYNGIDLDTFYPMITSIRQDTKLIAETMFRLIVNSSETPPPREVLTDITLVAGDTCRKI
ncbi:LacI family DNA-binding transcriptional regulator [Christensenella timonensis]|uniref:LacI family DNA-binding transcriptional regulator n=1 Tax=Christensenella timonensis TaxID=1816678 RepID=UPI00082D73C2|nr:LacI family DNA-binding transcriptional regulator [Christensenella timonensis]